MAKSPAFQFYPNDWLSSPHVALMTPEQEGGYIHLLCYDWANDGIPDDDKLLAALSRLGEGWLNGGSTVVKERFNQHPTKAGFLTNRRLQEERERQEIWREKSRQGGIVSGKTRTYNKTKGGCQMVEPNANSSSSSSSSSSVLITPTPSLKELPEKLNTARMQNQWKVWQNVRRGHKKPKSWVILFNTQIDWISQYDEPTAFGILQYSIMNGYQGLFPPKDYGNNSKNSRGNHSPNPRNVGITKGPTDYAEVFRRKQAEEMERQLAQNETRPPESGSA